MDYNMLEVRFPTLSSTPANPLYIPSWGTGGSSSVRSLWQPLRHAGAATRAMFGAAAAQFWQASTNQINHRNGVASLNGSDKQLRYADLLGIASELNAPDYQLKNPAEFKQLGKPLRRYDAENKVTGAISYGIDTTVPGQKYAALVRSPVYGSKPATFDAANVIKLPGIIDVVSISNGVAIIAERYWQAQSARQHLRVEWDNSSLRDTLDDRYIQEKLEAAFDQSGLIARDKGDIEKLTQKVAENATTSAKEQTLVAEYRVPFLAHSPMEPMNCTAWFHEGQCEVWAPTQRPPLAVSNAAKASGLPESAIILHTMHIGGGFGRRLAQDYVREAVEIANQVEYPVTLIWSREDDIQHGVFRPAMHCSLSAVLGANKIDYPLASKAGFSRQKTFAEICWRRY